MCVCVRARAYLQALRCPRGMQPALHLCHPGCMRLRRQVGLPATRLVRGRGGQGRCRLLVRLAGEHVVHKGHGLRRAADRQVNHFVHNHFVHVGRGLQQADRQEGKHGAHKGHG